MMKNSGPGKRWRVLIVDDEEDIARLTAVFIGEMGFDVMPAKDGREALTIIESFKPDIVVSDIHMPEIDGDELYRKIVVATPSYAKRFVFMTGSGIDSQLTQFLNDTGCLILTKPFDFQELSNVIERKIKDIQGGKLPDDGS